MCTSKEKFKYLAINIIASKKKENQLKVDFKKE